MGSNELVGEVWAVSCEAVGQGVGSSGAGLVSNKPGGDNGC